jgi:hypothetical protein
MAPLWKFVRRIFMAVETKTLDEQEPAISERMWKHG